MRVFHFTHELPQASGVATFVRELDAALGDEGVESRIVLDPRELPDAPEAETVLHIHGMWKPVYHQAAKWAKAKGIKIVWSAHGMLAPWSLRHKWWKKLPVWLAYQWRDLKSAAILHATSGKEVGWIRRLGFRQQIAEVSLGTHLPEVKEVKVERQNGKVLLFVGRVYPVKAIDRLIAAFASATDEAKSKGEGERENWQLRIVGPDQAGHRAELMRLCESLSLTQVVFVGPKYGAELAAEYVGCDALALVSHTENFGATVVDAMAHGKPVVTSTNTPWQEVADCGAGWWVDNDPASLAQAIGELMAMDDARRTEIGAKGRKLVEAKYTWAAVAQQMSEVYRRASGGGTPDTSPDPYATVVVTALAPRQ